jgi:hypothetical protein
VTYLRQMMLDEVQRRNYSQSTMSRPTLEVADIVHRTGNRFWQQQQSHLAWPHRKVLDAIVRCRTAALGGHRDQCVRCGHQAISFNSCRNRHCPKCQGNARAKWLAARSAELLPVPYFHIVFTLPHSLSALVLQNKRLLYDLLSRCSAATMLELARDPEHLGADIGFLGVLHTWGQNLEHHPHVHYIVPAGGLAPNGSSWIDSSPRSAEAQSTSTTLAGTITGSCRGPIATPACCNAPNTKRAASASIKTVISGFMALNDTRGLECLFRHVTDIDHHYCDVVGLRAGVPVLGPSKHLIKQPLSKLLSWEILVGRNELAQLGLSE